MSKLFKGFKTTNNNWVHKILNKRRMTSVYITFILALGIVGFYFYMEYSKYQEVVDRNNKIKERIVNSKDRLKKLDTLINSGKNRLDEINSRKIDNKKPVAFMNKVCELLKNREVIGAYYIFKKANPKYSNVLNLEIQVSYGDIDLLFLVTKIVMEKVFFLKSIEQTKNGVKCELYKPLEEGQS